MWQSQCSFFFMDCFVLIILSLWWFLSSSIDSKVYVYSNVPHHQMFYTWRIQDPFYVILPKMNTSKWLSHRTLIHQNHNHTSWTIILVDFVNWTHGYTYQTCFLPWRNNKWLLKECKIFAFSTIPRINVLQNINYYYPWMNLWGT